MTTVLDIQALQAAAGIRIPLAENVWVRSGSVTSEAVQGFSDVRAVELVVRVPVLRGHPAPSVTVTVEKSTNGSDWTTGHAFAFTATGEDSFTLDAPDDYLRVVCVPAGGLREAVVSVVASIVTVDAPAGESEGGGSQPVACVLACDAAFTIHDIGNYDVLWDALYDDLWNLDPLVAIPVGLGLTFAFDGSSSLIVPTVDGIWSLSYYAERAQESVWAGSLRNGGLGVNFPWVQQVIGVGNANGAPYLAGTITTPIPTGAQMTHQVATVTAAGIGAYGCSQVYLSIVRHA